MFVFFHKNSVSIVPSPNRRFLRAPFALGAAALLACFLSAIPAGVSAPPSSLGEDPQSGLLGDDGFTRETLTEFNAPEPAAFATVSTASVQAMHRRHYARTAARHRRQLQRERSGQSMPQVVVKSTPRRNPVESFVFWWNGWVINTFHTKVGTVMLGTIGAKDS